MSEQQNDQQANPPVEATSIDDLPADAEFRKVYPLTPLMRFWTLILALIAAFAININGSTISLIWGFIRGEHSIALWSLVASIGGFIVVCAVIYGASRMWWKATGFRLTDEEVQLKRGVFNKHLRTARYDRVQAVDIVESVIARIFRVASVRVETAGGNDSVIEIAFLKKPEAEQLRRELLDATHGNRQPHNEPRLAVEAEEVGEGVEKLSGLTVVPEIPIQRSIAGVALSLTTIILLVGGVLVLFTPVGVAAAAPFFIGFFPAVWGLIDKSWKFNATLNNDVLNVSYGLADRRRQSIPLGRIHAVSISQPLLWRLTGWWAVSVTVVGYGADTKQGGTTKILPVGSKEQAVGLLNVVSSLSAEEITTYADPARITHPDYRSPQNARWVSPIDRSQQGVTLVGQAQEQVVIVHAGRWIRRMKTIDVEHIQELTLNRGLIQRALGLSTVRLDLVPGPVQMQASDLTYEDGMELLDVLRQRRLPELVPARSDN